MAIEILHLSDILKSPLVDREGDRLGRVQDLIVRPGDSPHPPITGVVVRIGHRELWIPIQRIDEIRSGLVRFAGDQISLQRFERRPGELLLARDLMARHVINLQGVRIIRANEIELARVDDRWEVVGVDQGSRVAFRRVLPRVLHKHIGAGAIVDWASIEPFVAHVPSSRLHIPYRKLARLHPAQIADLVEAASHEEGQEIIEAVGQNRELEADVFEELDSAHQVEFVGSRSDAEAARLLATMAPDDAADLITALDQERRRPILELVPEPKQRKIRALLRYNSETAGGLMSPDFLCLPEDDLVAEALDAVRTSTVPHEALAVIFTADADGRVSGACSAVSLITADAWSPLREIVHRNFAHVHVDWDIHTIVRKMADFNLIVAAVLDDDHQRMLGVVTVDDIMELLLPAGWRRDSGMARAEE